MKIKNIVIQTTSKSFIAFNYTNESVNTQYRLSFTFVLETIEKQMSKAE